MPIKISSTPAARSIFLRHYCTGDTRDEFNFSEKRLQNLPKRLNFGVKIFCRYKILSIDGWKKERRQRYQQIIISAVLSCSAKCDIQP